MIIKLEVYASNTLFFYTYFFNSEKTFHQILFYVNEISS